MDAGVKQRFTIIGAGAIGGTAGAYLIRSGHDVLFVDQDAAHVDAMNTSGLTLEGHETFTVRARATTPASFEKSGESIAGTVLLCVKAMDTANALTPFVERLSSDAYIVSMQNGLNERTVASLVGSERTVGAFVNFGADYLEPGRVMFGGGGALYMGELDGRISERIQNLASTFQGGVLPNTKVTDNIWGYLWGKLAYGSMLFATALVDETIANVFDYPSHRPMLANLAGEVIRVAESEDVRCEAFDGFEPYRFAFRAVRDWDGIDESLDELAAFNRRSLKVKSGVWRDLAVRKRKTEVDQIVGAIVETGTRKGIPTPLNSRLQAMIHELEEGQREMDWANLAELSTLSLRTYGS